MDLLTPPFRDASFLPKGQDELFDPWEKQLQFDIRQQKTGGILVLIFTTAEDGTQISQFGIGEKSVPPEK